jgi:molybdate transport system substrate-binding protein
MFPLRAFLLSLVFCLAASGQTIRVAAAISLRDALQPIREAFEKQTPYKLELTFGASGQLLAQIKAGAEIDAFISAANAQVDDLEKSELTLRGTRRVIAGNQMVLIVPAAAKDPPQSLGALAEDRFRRIAIGQPGIVPAGHYAMQVFQSLKLDEKLKEKLVYGANVRQVLTYVEQGEVAAGMVYRTDAIVSGDKVRVVATAGADSHDPIVYPAVIIKSSRQQVAALAFLDFLQTAAAQAILAGKGFSPPTPPASNPAR